MTEHRAFWGHQHKAFAYSLGEKRPALFMDMRLGKTLATIRRVRLYQPRNPEAGLRVLIVAPSSAFGSWEDDLIKEGETSITYLIGPRDIRRRRLAWPHRWCIINKEGFLVLPELALCKWDAVILDESTFIKNPRAKVTKFFLSNFRDCPHRWVLTGLPNPESDLDYVCQILFLDGWFMGCRSYWDFRAKYFTPSRFGFGWIPKDGVIRQNMQEAIGKRCFIMRRKDAGVEVPKIVQTRKIDFPDSIRKIYDKVEQDYAIESTQASTIWATTRYVWLRRLCGGFLEKEMVWDGKLKELLSLLHGELSQEPVVVWFNFNDELRAVEWALKKARIDCAVMLGEVKLEDREKIRKQFNQGAFRVLLIQQAVAAAGMNLSRADTAIYYSEPVGQLARKQTEDRILVLGKKSVLLINLLVKNSVDEDVRAALIDKALRSDLSLSRALKVKMLGRVNTK